MQNQRHWNTIQGQDDESHALVMRLTNSIQAATFEMETLCKLAGIKATREIPTAAVECTFRPRLLINPDFVAKYCERNEHLFLLVMHELWHVLLAHTQVYSRATPAQNIAFDAIINANLSRQFFTPEYRGFFEAINPSDQFPGCLLRPPEGWPYNPRYPIFEDMPLVDDVLRRLYPPLPFGRWHPPLYEDILYILRKYMSEKSMHGENIPNPVLLGDHESPSSDAIAASNDYVQDMLRRVVEKWSDNNLLGKDRGIGGTTLKDVLTTLGNPAEDAKRTFSNILKRVLAPRYGKNQKRSRTPITSITGMGALPNPRDRMQHARERLKIPGLLWYQPGAVNVRQQSPTAHAFVYLDVSNSMNSVLPHLLGLLLPYLKRGEISVFQFSTTIQQLTYDQLKGGKLRSSQGTQIACVMQHLLNITPPVKHAVILTDGYTGVPHPEATRQIRDKKINLHVVLPSGMNNKTDLASVAKSITVLPEYGSPHP